MNGFQLRLLEDCVNSAAYGNLSDWEEEFIESLSGKPENYELSDKQNAVLNKISSRILP